METSSLDLVLCARTLRGGLVESMHFGAAAAMTADGTRLGAAGDPRWTTFARSSAKPFQALPLVLAGGIEAFDLSAEDLALICASHGGFPEHEERARELLARAGCGLEDLECGAHSPLDRRAARDLRAGGGEPGPAHNNCSGKHAGMLMTCRLKNWPTAGYSRPEHPLQQEILRWMATFCRVGAADLGLAVDGCSVPTFHLPLEALAVGYATLVEPETAGLAPKVARAAHRILSAMAGAPAMVAGPGRFTTRLIEVTGGRVIGKEGAEGMYAMAVRQPSDQSPACGIALKVVDGADRAWAGVAIELLLAHGFLSAAEVEALSAFRWPVLSNHRNLEVGHIVPEPQPAFAMR
ncbi:MAG: asparaginase [Acidobacteriota bacterium]